MKHTYLFFVFIFPFASFAQKNELIEINKNYSVEKVTQPEYKSFIEYRHDVRQAIYADGITYYGFDISHLILSDSEYIGKEEKVHQYLQAWIDRFHKMVPYYDVRKTLYQSKKDFDTAFKTVRELNNKKKTPWILKDQFNLAITDIAGIVESYKLDEADGTAFVVIAENFNKKGVYSPTYSSAWFTFFDIKTREILWATRVQMPPTGFGWTVYWPRGIIDGFSIFRSLVYEPQRRITKHSDRNDRNPD